MSITIAIHEKDFPSLYRVTDEASNRSQRNFLRLVKANLVLMILGATFSSIPTIDEAIKFWLAVAGSFLLVASFLVTIWIRFSEDEKTWYGGRAVAESVKTLAWRYMLAAEPYTLTKRLNDVENEFLITLTSILKEKKQLVVTFDDELNSGDQITAIMKATRALPWEKRLSVYLKFRIKDQRAWYSKKSKWNSTREKRWFAAVLTAQAVAFLFSLCAVKNPLSMNWTGVFAAAATALLMWLQVKKFRELAQVYAVTAQDLGFVEARSAHVSDDATLSNFVADAEHAISREHTLWIARRDH